MRGLLVSFRGKRRVTMTVDEREGGVRIGGLGLAVAYEEDLGGARCWAEPVLSIGHGHRGTVPVEGGAR